MAKRSHDRNSNGPSDYGGPQIAFTSSSSEQRGIIAAELRSIAGDLDGLKASDDLRGEKLFKITVARAAKCFKRSVDIGAVEFRSPWDGLNLPSRPRALEPIDYDPTPDWNRYWFGILLTAEQQFTDHVPDNPYCLYRSLGAPSTSLSDWPLRARNSAVICKWIAEQLDPTNATTAVGQPNNRVREPLSENEQRVYECIKSKQPIAGKAISIATGVPGESLRKYVIPKLKKDFGLKNRRGVGYYFDDVRP